MNFNIGKKISKNSPVYFIADIASNHDGNQEQKSTMLSC